MKRDSEGRFQRGLVYGVGVDDVEGSKEYCVNGKRVTDPAFSTWKNMLKRCYHSEYKGKTMVHPVWWKFSAFKTWYDKNYVEGYELDKDMWGGTMYSPTSCCFIPTELNHFLVGINQRCGSYYDQDRCKYQAYTKSYQGERINIGRFDTEDEAVYHAKLEKIKELNKIIPTMPKNIQLRLLEVCDNLYFNFIKPVIKVGE